LNELADKAIVVTGAAGGIGRETTRLFLDAGARLLLIDRDEAALAELATTLAAGERVRTVVSPIDSPAACAQALDAAARPIYGLVHLAGLFEPDGLTPDDRAIWDRAMAANLTNAYDMAIACVPRFDPDATCRVVLISSLAFRRGAYDHVSYTAAKGGIVGLVRALSRRLAPGVLVNGLAPGIIDTPMPARIIARRGDRLIRDIPLKRWGQPREVATVIGFLLGEGSSYITGQVINVDGGVAND
jgi:3-oxoacyl-[acyl-carrier protein] reductase